MTDLTKLKKYCNRSISIFALLFILERISKIILLDDEKEISEQRYILD